MASIVNYGARYFYFYYYNSRDQLTEADRQILIYFSLLHDIGRTSEDRNDAHGDASVQLIHAKALQLKGIRLSRKDYFIAELLIRYHCRDDKVGFDVIQTQTYLSRKDKERAMHLYKICKDMDELIDKIAPYRHLIIDFYHPATIPHPHAELVSVAFCPVPSWYLRFTLCLCGG